jgi:hypothetical protein
MATTKLNKEKLKRMMEQKDTAPVSLGKKRRADTASKPTSNDVMVRPSTKESSPVGRGYRASGDSLVQPGR